MIPIFKIPMKTYGHMLWHVMYNHDFKKFIVMKTFIGKAHEYYLINFSSSTIP